MEKRGVDVMIVGRGGGSIEDLWAFNEEAVAQAVFDCNVPIISAVGHETDTTIIDFVSDLRAPTPSAAAELAVYDVQRFQEQLNGYKAILERQITGRITLYRARLKAHEAKIRANSPMGKIREKRTYAINLEERLNNFMKNQIMQKRHRLAVYIERLKGLSPLDKLNQGYAYVSDQDGRTVTDIERVSAGDKLWVFVKNGKLKTEVIDKYPTTSDLKDKQSAEGGT